MKSLIFSMALASVVCATTLPFEDNLNTLDPACVSARPDGDQNTKGCGQFKSIGLNRYGYPTVSLVNGAFQCTYGRIEDECRAQIHFTETDSIYTYFELTYASDYDFGAGQKIMRWSSYPSTLISDHIMYSTRGNPSNGRYAMAGIYAERNGGSGQYGGVSYSMQRGVKYRVKNFLKMNTGGQSNGIFRLWINDTLRINSMNLSNFRASGDTHGFTMVTFMGWLSGSNPASPATYWVDNPRVSLTNDFANWPFDAGTPPPVIPPKPPSNVVYDTSWAMSADSVYYRIVTTRNIRTIGVTVTQPIRTIASIDTSISRDTTRVP